MKGFTCHKRKTTRGRCSVALFDREPLETYRTPATGFPAISFVVPALAAVAAVSFTITYMGAPENSDESRWGRCSHPPAGTRSDPRTPYHRHSCTSQRENQGFLQTALLTLRCSSSARTLRNLRHRLLQTLHIAENLHSLNVKGSLFCGLCPPGRTTSSGGSGSETSLSQSIILLVV